MNQTNRVTNRLILLITGVVLVAVGAGVITVYVWPAAAKWWDAASANALNWVEDADSRTLIGTTAVSWLAAGSLAAILLLIVLLSVALARLGGGHSSSLIRTGGQDSPHGRIVIETAFAADALRQSLDQRPEVLGSRVSTVRIRRTPMMHLSITPRQNTSPKRLLDDVEHLLDNLAILTGEALPPTYLSIHTGLRSRLAHEHSRVS